MRSHSLVLVHVLRPRSLLPVRTQGGTVTNTMRRMLPFSSSTCSWLRSKSSTRGRRDLRFHCERIPLHLKLFRFEARADA